MATVAGVGVVDPTIALFFAAAVRLYILVFYLFEDAQCALALPDGMFAPIPLRTRGGASAVFVWMRTRLPTRAGPGGALD